MNSTQKQNTTVKNEVAAKPQQRLIEWEKNISDNVQNRVTELVNAGRLNLPTNYSVGNALMSAWLILQDLTNREGVPVLKACTENSIRFALLDMAILGHNPNKHGYFIPYGNRLTWFPSYLGKSASLKRLKGFENEPIATLIYEGDELELNHNELGEETIVNHKSSWANKMKNNIVGAYATVKQGEKVRSAVMTMEEIKESWLKNPSKGNKREHLEFIGEFAKRTVINRLIKVIIKTSNDDDLLAETMISNEEQHYDFEGEVIAEEKAKLEIATNANQGETIVIKPEDFEKEQPKQQIQPELFAQPQEAKVANAPF